MATQSEDERAAAKFLRQNGGDLGEAMLQSQRYDRTIAEKIWEYAHNMYWGGDYGQDD